MFSEDNIKTN